MVWQLQNTEYTLTCLYLHTIRNSIKHKKTTETSELASEQGKGASKILYFDYMYLFICKNFRQRTD